MPVAIADMDDAKGKKVYDSAHELEKIFTLKSADELKTMLDEHYHCKTVADTAPVAEEKVAYAPSTKSSKSTSSDDDIKSILDSLDVS